MSWFHISDNSITELSSSIVTITPFPISHLVKFNTDSSSYWFKTFSVTCSITDCYDVKQSDNKIEFFFNSRHGKRYILKIFFIRKDFMNEIKKNYISKIELEDTYMITREHTV